MTTATAATLPTPAAIAELMTIAERLARAAGALILDGRRSTVRVAATKSSPVDVVTAMDTASERLLRDMLAELRPLDGVLGEEQGTSAGTSDITWVVDPIDGTVNYLYGIPNYAVSVAAVAGPPDPATWTALAGCVHAPALGATYTGGAGLGAFRDGQAIRANEPRPLAMSLLGTGFGYTRNRRIVQAEVIAHLLPQFRDIRRLGSSALDLCAVAEGRLDLYFERGLKPWDMAAGALIATEAGATVVGLRSDRPGEELAIAGPKEGVETLRGLLLELDADRDAPDTQG